MAAEWYYTTNKKQMGPVSWDELRQLAGNGLLKPTDLVWTEGMAEWVRAAAQDGLFAAPAAGVTAKPGKRAAAVLAEEEAPRRRRRTRRDDEDDEDDEEEDDRPRKRKKAASKGMATGLKIGLIVGGAVLLLGALGCGGLLIGMSMMGGGAPPVGPQTYTVNNLRPKTKNDRNVFFQAGKAVTVSVNSNVMMPRTDVDLHVIHNGQIIAMDEALVPNCRVNFVPAASGNYTLQVRNLGPGSANCTVTYSQVP